MAGALNMYSGARHRARIREKIITAGSHRLRSVFESAAEEWDATSVRGPGCGGQNHTDPENGAAPADILFWLHNPLD
jgi:hypothetical protein